ncbi:MAG: response regulator [Nitrospirae bacterium]|nr:response regulator [Nitrospirota bacterium]
MGAKVLVAESDSTVQQVVSYFLNLEGFEVVTASDGIAALEAVEAHQPEAVLLSPVLSGINGIEVSRLILEKSQFRDMPILFIVESEDSLLKMGGDLPMGYGVIRKPIDPTKMVDTLNAYMGKGEPPAAKAGESVSIEELLGWDVTEAARTKVTEWQEAAPDSPDIAGIASGMFETKEAMVPEEIREQTHEAPPEEPVEAPAEEEAAAATTETPVSMEADLRDRITDDMIEEIISRIAREIVERAAWEVVPKIAEEEIRREIERLKGESG